MDILCNILKMRMVPCISCSYLPTFRPQTPPLYVPWLPTAQLHKSDFLVYFSVFKMLEAVLCRFDKSKNLYEPGTIVSMSEHAAEVQNVATGETTVFQSPEAGTFHDPSELDIVRDVMPSGKLVNIGCPVLVPTSQNIEGAFELVHIFEKEYKPLRVTVRFVDDTVSLSYSREDIRVMLSPWSKEETTEGDDTEIDGEGCEDQEKTLKRTKKHRSSSSTKYKKGDTKTMPHGVIKKVISNSMARL